MGEISDLVPSLLEKEPVGPLTGQPLIHKAKENGFIVHSLGHNQKDDGARMSTITQADMDKDYDWSWQASWH